MFLFGWFLYIDVECNQCLHVHKWFMGFNYNKSMYKLHCDVVFLLQSKSSILGVGIGCRWFDIIALLAKCFGLFAIQSGVQCNELEFVRHPRLHRCSNLYCNRLIPELRHHSLDIAKSLSRECLISSIRAINHDYISLT